MFIPLTLITFLAHSQLDLQSPPRRDGTRFKLAGAIASPKDH